MTTMGREPSVSAGEFLPVLTFSLTGRPRAISFFPEKEASTLVRTQDAGSLLTERSTQSNTQLIVRPVRGIFPRRLARTCRPEVYKIRYAVYQVILLLRWPISSFLNISDRGALYYGCASIHSRDSFCASSICFLFIFSATLSRLFM